MKYGFVVLILLGAFALPGFSQGKITQDRNVRNCLDGIGTCNTASLTEAQAKQLMDLRHDRNLSKCLSGYVACDHSLLTPAQAHKSKKREAAAQKAGELFLPRSAQFQPGQKSSKTSLRSLPIPLRALFTPP